MGKYSEYVNAENLRAERARKRYSYERMSKELGKKSKSSYQDIEKGNCCPKITDMVTISKVLGKPMSYFFNIDVRESSTNSV